MVTILDRTYPTPRSPQGQPKVSQTSKEVAPPTPADSPAVSSAQQTGSSSQHAGTSQSQSLADITNLSSHDLMMNHLAMANNDSSNTSESASHSLDITSGDALPVEESMEDMPLLVSDNDAYSDDESTYSGKSAYSHRTLKARGPSHLSSTASSSVAASTITSFSDQSSTLSLITRRLESRSATPVDSVEEVKRSMKESTSTSSASAITTVANVSSIPSTVGANTSLTVPKREPLSAEHFKHERNQLMTIIVKYIATKIHNSFPPESPRLVKPDELPLDKFLLLLSSRLQLSLPMFMKGIIYLFRYMDIIYLLRYLNQSNNFANYTDMGFELKKLIIGCFKLAIMKEKRLLALKPSTVTATAPSYEYNWSAVTGLSSKEINTIVKQLVSRMNGKLNIKNIELIKLKSEIFRFVKMVATEV